MEQMQRTFGGGTEAAASAISEEMVHAMLRYMPLRGILSFGGGQVSYEQLEALVQKINER